ncbi:MAG: glycosyltransferase [Flavobacterium sp.]|nr:glycosyltransferase [Flavobacterium sp.]
MAVNYANGLSNKIAFSGLIATRKEGVLKEQLEKEVQYSFLNKKNNYDVRAFFKLRAFCIQNKVQFIHAHSSSFFWAVLVKLTYPKVKVVWHDHYGNSEFLNERSSLVLSIFSYFFSNIIAVNEQLKKWSEKKLNCDKVSYLPNFVIEENIFSNASTELLGKEEKRIVLLANLRPQKNHFFLLKIAENIVQKYPDWTFHLVGKDFQDDYSSQLKQKIKELNLHTNLFLYGTKEDISNILKQSTIGILTSKSEGLPVALLEYGIHGLPVIATSVGEIPKIIKNNDNGILVEVDDFSKFVSSLSALIEDNNLRVTLGGNLKVTIENDYTDNAVFKKYFGLINGN